jgi:hypothetical protein
LSSTDQEPLSKRFSWNNLKRYAMVPVFDKVEESIFRFGPEDEPDGIGVQGVTHF